MKIEDFKFEIDRLSVFQIETEIFKMCNNDYADSSAFDPNIPLEYERPSEHSVRLYGQTADITCHISIYKVFGHSKFEVNVSSIDVKKKKSRNS